MGMLSSMKHGYGAHENFFGPLGREKQEKERAAINAVLEGARQGNYTEEGHSLLDKFVESDKFQFFSAILLMRGKMCPGVSRVAFSMVSTMSEISRRYSSGKSDRCLIRRIYSCLMME